MDKFLIKAQDVPQNLTKMPDAVSLQIDSRPPKDLGDNPRQPSYGNFPADDDRRKFKSEWFKKFKWLEYSAERDAAFCFACRKYGTGAPNHMKRFTVEGFRQWKHALGDSRKGLVQHDNSSVHGDAMAAWRNQNLRLETNSTVAMLVSNDVLDNRRYYVKSIAEIVQFLAINELSFRGSYEKSEHEEHGLFMELFKYTLTKDAKLAKIAEDIPKNATLRSGRVQNDVINLMATMVSENVAEELKKSDTGKFTLLADGTRNKCRVENMSCAVRYVKDGEPKEHLVVIKATDKLDANSLTDVLLSALDEVGVDASNMISQCYDGASCMSGEHGGVQKLIQDRLGRQIPYEHCKNHRLHLVVVDLVSGIPALSQFFDEISSLYKLFSKFKVDKMYEGTSLKRVITTRWSGHYDSTVAVVENYEEIVAVLEAMCDNSSNSQFDTDTIATAIGLSRILKREEFQFCAVLMKKLLGLLKPADTVLQKRETDINESIKLINTSIGLLKSLRSEEGYAELKIEFTKLNDIVGDAFTNEHCEPRPKRRRTMNIRLTDFFVTESLHQTIEETVTDQEEIRDRKRMLLFEVLDKVLTEMNLRFTDNTWLYSSVRALSRDNKTTFLDRPTLMPLSTHLGIPIPSIEELKVAKQFLMDYVPIAESQDSNLVLQKLYKQKEAFPNVFSLAATVATFGSSSAVCESGFSVLTRIDKPTRRSMLQNRQANLVLLAFEKELTKTIDMDLFVKKMIALHPRLLLGQ